jgi:serine/threonine-protein kinase
MSAVGAGMWTFGIVIDRLLIYRDIPLYAMPDWNRALMVHVVGVAISLAMFGFVRYGRQSAATKSDVGLVYMVFSALLVALLNSWVRMPMIRVAELSWVTIVILVYSMIAPTTPRKIAGASVVAASMDPLVAWFSHPPGVPVLSMVDTLIIFSPNYVCAGVAALQSHVIAKLGRQIRQAREMGSYRLVERLGHGGMGEVWRAEHRLLAHHAAIKLVRPEVLGAGSVTDVRLALRRFEREAQATAALSSPNSIRLFDFGITREGSFYYVMELLAGRDLETLIREFGPLPANRVMYLLRQVCHSLAEAHARGLVHRDIKPANIYVCRMGLDYDFVKVLDFGLVKFKKQDAGQSVMTADHTTTGTPGYMAPELIMGEADTDRRADVYALGCVAYYMLTGQPVFEADTPMKILIQHVQERPVPPSIRAEVRIPRELDELVLACLEKDPNKRPQDAAELFRLACGCGACGEWTNESAIAWWETHLPELTGPLAPVESKTDTTSRVTALH